MKYGALQLGGTAGKITMLGMACHRDFGAPGRRLLSRSCSINVLALRL